MEPIPYGSAIFWTIAPSKPIVTPSGLSNRMQAFCPVSFFQAAVAPWGLSVEQGHIAPAGLRTMAWLAGQRGAPQNCGTEM